jgi:bifunctional non-homologous end joining protein LigD
MESMSKTLECCKPINAKAVPGGPDWIHEVKYDDYRGRVVRDGRTVKILSKSGLDWTWNLKLNIRPARWHIGATSRH